MLKNRIAQIFKQILLMGIYKEKEDFEKVRRLVLINTITLVAIIVLMVIAVISYTRGYPLIGILDVSAAIVLTCCLIYLRRTGNQKPAIYVGIGIMTALFGYMFFTGGVAKTGYLWYYTFPLFTLYIMSSRDGLIANLILFVPSTIYLLAIWPTDNPLYSQDFTIRFIPSLLSVLIFSYLFETTRSRTHAKLKRQQVELESSIVALCDKENELQRAHDELELRIEERTKALRDANDILRVEIEERKRSETLRRKLELQLRRAEKMEAIGSLAGGVAHDLNNILSGVTSYPELLLMNLPEDSPMRMPLETIRNSGEKAVTVVQDLLTLSRRSAAAFQIIDLQAVTTEYLESPEYKKMLSYHDGINIKTDCASSPYLISGSKVHLSKTIMNLITNAAEAMPDGGTIRIRIEHMEKMPDDKVMGSLKPGKYVKLSISDNGSGIAPEVIDHIFEPFFTTKKMGRSGTGLGMAVVWGTIQDHQGHIEVRSKVSEGTTFDLYFPEIKTALLSQQPIETDLLLGNNESILVVDDIAEQREIAGSILERLGYTVKTVSSGELAVAYLRDTHADLVILDMIMPPGISGLETCARIMAFKPDQRVLIASGYAEADVVKQARRLGAHDFIKKPYTIRDISTAVRAALFKP